MGMKYDVPSHPDLKFVQITLWLVSLLYNSSRTGYDEIQIGAVMNDDMVSFIDDIKKIWSSFTFLSKEKHPPLTFPIMKESKWNLSKDLPKKYKDLVVFCEDPNIIKPIDENNTELLFENCGYCHSCKRYKFDSDYLGIEYGQIKSIDTNYDMYTPMSNDPIDSIKKVKSADIILGVTKSTGTIKNKITISKSKRKKR